MHFCYKSFSRISLTAVYSKRVICQNLQFKKFIFFSFLSHPCRKYQFSEHEKLYTSKIVITRQLQLYEQRYSDSRILDTLSEKSKSRDGFVSASADVISVEIAGPRCPRDVNFSCTDVTDTRETRH